MTEFSFEKKIRNRHLLDIKYLIDVAREREESLKQEVTLNFKIEKDSLNLEELFRKDLIGKIGFSLHTDVRYEKQGADSGIVDLRSVFSYLYGVKESDTQTVKEKKYTCNCEVDNIKKAGTWCDKCKSYAIEHKYTRGWFSIDKFKVFNPDMFSMLMKYKVGGANLRKSSNYRADKTDSDKNPWLVNPECKYNIYELQKPGRLLEYIKEHVKVENQTFFIERIDRIMTSKIPAVSKNLRHHQVITKLDGTSDIRSHEINKYLILINNKIDDLNKDSEYMSKGKILRYLADINKNYLAIYDQVLDIIGNGKGSDIRGKIGGRRKGNSSKLLIESKMTHVTHECSISYAAFGIMFLEWHYELFVKHGMTAESEFRIRQVMPSKDDFPLLTKVLRELQEQDLAWICSLREPVLYRASLQGMYVSGLTDDGSIRVGEITLGVGYKGDKDM
ncbi:MAG: hypothetical protein ACRCX2_20275 [Paraclostridium sp.]